MRYIYNIQKKIDLCCNRRTRACTLNINIVRSRVENYYASGADHRSFSTRVDRERSSALSPTNQTFRT